MFKICTQKEYFKLLGKCWIQKVSLFSFGLFKPVAADLSLLVTALANLFNIPSDLLYISIILTVKYKDNNVAYNLVPWNLCFPFLFLFHHAQMDLKNLLRKWNKSARS